MSEWISAETPPVETGTYVVCFDRTVLWEDAYEQPVPDYAEPWEVNTCIFVDEPRHWMTGPFTGSVAYWQPLPEPPLEEMIRDRLRGKALFLVPGEE